jgi:hypothetical protein
LREVAAVDDAEERNFTASAKLLRNVDRLRMTITSLMLNESSFQLSDKTFPSDKN